MNNNVYSKSLVKSSPVNIDNFQIVKFIGNQKKDDTIIMPINSENIINIMANQNIHINNFIIDQLNNIYFVGYLTDNLNFEKENINLTLSNKSFIDIVFGKIDYNGKINYCLNVPGLNDDEGLDIILDNHNNIYICGYFSESITFGPTYLHSKNRKTLFVSKYNPFIKQWIWTKCAGYINNISEAKYIKWYQNQIYLIGIFYNKITFEQTLPLYEITSNGKNILVTLLDDKDGEWKYINYMYIKDNDDVIDYKISKHGVDITFAEYGTQNDCIKKIYKNYFDITNKLDNNPDYKYNFDNNIKLISYKNGLLVYYNTTSETYTICKNYVITHTFNFRRGTSIFDVCQDKQQNIIIIGYTNDKIKIGNKYLYGKCYYIAKINNSNTCIYISKLNKRVFKINYMNDFYILNDYNNIIMYVEDDRYLKGLGIVKNNQRNNNDVEIFGNIKTGFEDLKPGYEYYIQKDGTLDIISNDYYIGTAVTTTQLLTN